MRKLPTLDPTSGSIETAASGSGVMEGFPSAMVDPAPGRVGVAHAAPARWRSPQAGQGGASSGTVGLFSAGGKVAPRSAETIRRDGAAHTPWGWDRSRRGRSDGAPPISLTRRRRG